MFDRLLTSLVWLLGCVTFLSLDIFVYKRGILPIPPILFDAALVGASLIYLSRSPRLLEFGVWRLLGAVLMLSGFGAILQGASSQGILDLKNIGLALVFASAWLMLLEKPHLRRALQASMAVSMVVLAIMAMYEVFYPMTMSESYGRSAGSHENPNHAARAACLMAALMLSCGASFFPKALVVGFSGVIVLTSFSRGGFLCWPFIALAYAWGEGLLRARTLVTVAVGAVAVVAAYQTVPREILELDHVADRMALISGSAVKEDSANSRMSVIRSGLSLATEKPLLGHGPGRASNLQHGSIRLGAHNEHLKILIDYGFLGFLCWIIWILSLMRGRVPVLGLCFLVMGLFFHDMLLNRQALLAALAAEAWSRYEPRPRRSRALDSPAAQEAVA